MRSSCYSCDLAIVIFVACLYHQNRWFVGIVNNISGLNEDPKLSFMHSKGRSHFSELHQRENICRVPFEHILCILNPPNSSQYSRNYLFDNTKMVNVMSNTENLIQKTEVDFKQIASHSLIFPHFIPFLSNSLCFFLLFIFSQ